MSISTYSELQTAITNWLDRDDIASARVQEFITLAETRISRKLRVRGMETRDTSITTSGGTRYYTLPTDFIEARNIQINTNPIKRLKYLTPERMDTQYNYTQNGEPEAFTIIGEEIQLAPVPDGTYTLEIAYYQKITALSGSNQTNWLTSNAPDLLLYGSLIEAEAYLLDDPRLPLWKSLFDESVREFNTRDSKGRHSGSSLAVSVETTP